MNSKLKTIVLAAVLALQATTAGAWGKIVHDPKNFVVNQAAAKAAMKTEIEAVTQTLHQFNQLKTQYQQLKQLDPRGFTQLAADTAKDAAGVEAYLASNQAVLKALGGQDDFITAIQRHYVAYGEGDLKDYMQVLTRRAAAGNLQARSLFDMAERVGADVERTSNRRMVLQKQNEGAIGVMQAAQTTNQYLDVIVSQNADIQALLAEQVKLLAEEKAKKAAVDDAAKAKIADQVRREKESLDTFSERWKFKKQH